MTVEMVPTSINGRWELLLPAHRAARPEWPEWEAPRLAAMFELIGPGDVVVDLGAEEGDFPALWSSWGADVVLVEPNPRVWPNIKAIWEAIDLKAPLGWYVGFASNVTDDHPAASDVHADDRGGWPACAWGDVIGDHGFRHLAEETDTTPQIRVDELLHRLDVRPTVITLDIEGAELAALQGAEDTLRTVRPTVFASLHRDPLRDFYGLTPEDVRAFVRGCGYAEVFLAEDHEAHWAFLPC